MATQATGQLTTVGDDYFDLVRRWPLAPIRNDDQLDAANVMIDELLIIDEDRLTPGQGAYLSVLCDLTDAYDGHLVDEMTADVTGRDVLVHLAEENDLTAADVGRLVGRPDAGAGLLDGTVAITSDDVATLGKRFCLRAEAFLKQRRA